MRPPKVSPLPDRIKPQLLTMASRPPSAPGWLFELKYDGFRMQARIDSGVVSLITKNGFDWTKRMPRLARELKKLPVKSAWLDGEVVIQDEEGWPCFQPLQVAFSSGKTDPIVYFAFDLMYLNNVDLREHPVEQRRAMLAELLDQCSLDRVRFSETLEVDPHHLLENVRRLGLEGIVGKRIGSAYKSERNGDWIKIKSAPRQEFVILGYSRAAGGIGSLLIGLYDDTGQLVYAGRVRSGFDNKTLKLLRGKLAALEQSESALKSPPKLAKGIVVAWVEPLLVCEVKFTEITPAGKVRHAVFLGLREDKPASEVSLEMDTHEPQ